MVKCYFVAELHLINYINLSFKDVETCLSINSLQKPENSLYTNKHYNH